LHAFFSPKSGPNNTLILKCVGHIKGEYNVNDEQLQCNREGEDKTSYQITDNVHAKFFKCNLRDSFLMTTRTLPIMYCSIMFQNNLMCSLLFNIYVEFVISSEIKTEKQLIGAPLIGQYRLRIKINDTDPEKVIDLESFTGYNFMMKLIIELIETNEMKTVIGKTIEDERKKRIEKYGSLDDIEIPKVKYNFSELVKQYKKSGKVGM